MKRFVISALLVSCSSGDSKPGLCQPTSCAEYHHDLASACGKMDDGCGKQLDCGPCDLTGLGGSGGSCGLAEPATTETVSATSSATSSVSTGQGGANMCQDLTFDK